MNRRHVLTGGCGALGLALAGFPLGWVANAAAVRRRLLFFTKSSGFEHPVIKRGPNGELGHAERVMTELGATHDFEVVCSKDGGLFTAENLAKFDGYIFYTTGDLTQAGTDKQPPMTSEGKAALLEAVRNGKGFIGTHSATDTFHTAGDRFVSNGERVDPYIAMIGAEFIRHGPQQKAKMLVTDPAFPGFKELGESFELHEEWYSLKDFARNLHVLLVQETMGMTGKDYERGPFPATWARLHGRGRVFYTSMGHREDVWTNSTFQSIFVGGISWAVGNADASIPPNLERAAPKHADLPPR